MRLPRSLRPRQVVRALKRAGWTVDHQTGSHVVLKKTGRRPVTVPNHPTIKAGTLRTIITQAGLSLAEFVDLL